MARGIPYILADDLTGACDAGLAFLGRFDEVRVCRRLEEGAAAGALCALNAASRALPPEEAARVVGGTVREAAAAGGRLLLKKVDSTLRGNLSAELAAAARAGRCERVVFCPAFPAQGRTVAGGVLRVDGTPLSRARLFEGGRPVRLPDRPAQALGPGLRAAEVGLEAVRRGADALRRAIEAVPRGTVVCVDAEEEGDLDLLAEAAAGRRGWLCAGAAGWARAMARRLPRRGAAGRGYRPLRRPAVFLLGSLNPASRDQARFLGREEGVRVFPAGFATRLDDPAELERHAAALRTKAGGYLGTVGARAAVIVSDPPRAGRVPPPGQAGEVARWLARSAMAHLRGREAGGVLFCGGDIAQAFLDEGAAGGLRLEAELFPGIALCRLSGGPFDGAAAVTKPGGFGGRDVLSRILARWRGEREGG